MSKWHDDFDAVYCIGLASRPDRTEAAALQLAAAGLEDRVEWVDGVVWYPGQYGCTASHREVWRRALEAGHERIMVFEDDVVCHASVWGSLPAPEEDWDILNLGGFWDKRSRVLDRGGYWMRVTNVWSTAALALTRPTMERLLTGIPPLSRRTLGAYRRVGHIDWWMLRQAAGFRVLHPYQLAFSQSWEAGSNIANHKPKNGWFAERFKKYAEVVP